MCRSDLRSLRDKIYTNMNTPLGISLTRDFTVIDELLLRLLQVTGAQVVAAERRLAPICPHEKSLGILENECTRALYTLGRGLSSECSLEEASAESAIEELTEQEHRSKAALVDMLEDVVIEMFQAQAKMDVDFHEKGNVAVRKGWVLVRDVHSGGPAGMIQALISGRMPGM